MKILKLLSAFTCGIIACFTWQPFTDCGIEPRVEKTLTQKVKEIQTQIGCEKIDGLWGPETTQKFKIAARAEDEDQFSQYAVKWYKAESY
tara:strand:- start:5 stop:274 length:270 start_codon:yes stop_codon:yes gene_type:complete